jgi:hypothetical protein
MFSELIGSFYGLYSHGFTRRGVQHCKLSVLFREIITASCDNHAAHVPVNKFCRALSVKPGIRCSSR